MRAIPIPLANSPLVALDGWCAFRGGMALFSLQAIAVAAVETMLSLSGAAVFFCPVRLI